ncbi:5600_t:CDS:2 [Entrophospora sp. SA101]|nr:6812_t:CDS:2 [Entrophospora sp. SA101]CAJ0845490.1 5600_t:CDS:2 [Entrophospora sp. SA101]
MAINMFIVRILRACSSYGYENNMELQCNVPHTHTYNKCQEVSKLFEDLKTN